MSPEAIAEERRRGRVAGAVAVLSGLLFSAGVIWSQIATKDIPKNDDAAELRFVDGHAGDIIGSSALRSLAALLLPVVTVHVYRATKARKPELSPVVLVVGIYGPLALAIGGLLRGLFVTDAAADFTSRAHQTEKLADHLLHGGLGTVGTGFAISGTAALAFWFAMGSLNAMRVGLLTRFMGMLGIVIGPMLLIIAPAPVVMSLWLIAVGLLLLDFWPRGMPPAWAAGQAVPWPSPGDSREEPREEIGAPPNGEVEPVGPGVRKTSDEADRPEVARGRPRKRKRRR